MTPNDIKMTVKVFYRTPLTLSHAKTFKMSIKNPLNVNNFTYFEPQKIVIQSVSDLHHQQKLEKIAIVTRLSHIVT